MPSGATGGKSASVDLRHCWRGNYGRTALHRIAHNKSPSYTAVIAALVEAGADVNALTSLGIPC